ncbi:MAG: hypothetical protein U5L07_17945 [Desulfobacterales bacterium]|nr:hypothetical protein [Desulfobacterales bacterium]
MKRILIFASILVLLFSGKLFAAPGDVIVEDLHDSASIGSKDTRNVVWDASECADGVAPCVMMDCADGDCSGTDGWRLNIPDGKGSEITIVWWERYDTWPLEWSVGGCKSIRPYNGSSSDEYLAALISFHGGDYMYLSTWEEATVEFNPDVVTEVRTNTYSYCTENPDGSYDCPHGRIGWQWEGMGTEWRKMRQWIKMPTSYSSGDGEIKLWVDGKLHYHVYDKDMWDRGGLEIESVAFAPVDESATPHGHWYDEITIYEGYVPPDDEPTDNLEPLEAPTELELTPY